MRRPQPLETDERRAEMAARAALLDVVLPRLLRLVRDADAEANAVLGDVLRRLGGRPVRGATTPAAFETMAQAAVTRMLGSAVRDERDRRAAELGNDGTP